MVIYNKQTPILIIVPTPVKTIPLLFERIKYVEPQQLYLICDEEELKVNDEHYLQIQNIIKDCPWYCRIKTLFKKNLGYEETIRKTIQWFFQQENEGIIIDGRILPSPGLLAFCSVLLEKYRNDERIGQIAGWNFLNEKPESDNDSYYFSKLVSITGCWGSWRRVWIDFEVQLKTFPAFKKQQVLERAPTHKPSGFSWLHLNYIKYSLVAQYEYINLINNRLSIVPNIPLDHTINDAYEWNEIIHPLFITDNITIDLKYQELRYNLPAITKNVPDGYTYIKKQILSMHNTIIRPMKIPKIIHQIYEDPLGPAPDLLVLASTWKEKHPDWEYRFWDKQMIFDFLESRCPDFIPYYRSYPFNVQRWDAIRYLILYHIGGLYVDFDYKCLEPLDVLLNGKTCCMGMEPTVNARFYHKPLIVGNALMASIPKHPYMGAIIEDMKSKFSKNYKMGDSMQIMETTGPFMVTRVYEQFKKKKKVTLLPACLVTPLSMKEIWMLQAGYITEEVEKKVEKAFAIHYFLGSWTPQTTESKLHKNKK
jgi:mannosyltransferase OCH1-like enzyme